MRAVMVGSSSATPPPKLVALRWRTRAPASGAAKRRNSATAASPMKGAYASTESGGTATAWSID